MNVMMRNSRLDFLWVELTNDCNLECIHCYASSGPGAGATDTLSFNQYVEVLEDARSQGCEMVQFIGGEATLYRDLVKLLRTAVSLQFREIEVYTNLISLPTAFLEILKEGGVRVATSFYAASAEIHDMITTRPGSWQKTTNNIRRLLEMGVDIRASIVLMDENREELQKTENFLRSIGVERVSFDHARPFGRGARREHACSDMEELCGKCSDGVACVSAEGKVFPCIMSRAWEIGDVGARRLSEVLLDAPLTAFRAELDGLNLRRTRSELVAGGCSPCGPADCSPGSYCEPQRICPPKS